MKGGDGAVRGEHRLDGGASWLCAGPMERQRMLDMDRRVAPVRRYTLCLLALALLVAGPWLGWWTLIPLVLAAGLFAVADRLVGRVERPEYALFAAWAGAVMAIAAATALVDGPAVATLSWLAIPVVTLSARFNLRGVVTGVAIALACLLAVGLTDWGDVSENPPILIAPAALIITTAMLSTALMRSEMEHRSEALLDPLTGMLTRRALEERVEVLEQQSGMSGQPVAVIVGDLDCLKEINDGHGHEAGDEALRQAARAIRGELRAFDLAYRIGGDEFVVLMPGADAGRAGEMARRLGQAVAARSPEDIRLGMSFGYDSCSDGERFDFAECFRRADRALLRAKRSGGGDTAALSGRVA